MENKDKKKGPPTARGGRTNPGGGRRPGRNAPGRTQPAQHQPPKLLGAKLGRGTPALQSLDEHSKPLYDRWVKDTQPRRSGKGPIDAAPAQFNADQLAKLSLEHLAVLMDCVVQSGRSTQVIGAALTQLQQAAVALIQDAKEGAIAVWSLEGLLFAVSACGKAAVLDAAQSLILRLLPVLVERLPAVPGEQVAPGNLQAFELNPSELALLVNRLSKFARLMSGQAAFTELALVVDQLAAMVEGHFDEHGRSQVVFTFKNFAQLVNGLAKFRGSSCARSAIVPLARAARAELIKCGHPAALDTDPDATGLSLINLCALVNGLAGFAGLQLTSFDAADASDVAADEALREAVETAATLANEVKDWSKAGMPALAQLVHGFGRFSRVPVACQIVVKLAASVVERLSRDAAWRDDPLYIKIIGMLAAGFGNVIVCVPAAQRDQMSVAVSLLSSYVPKRPSNLQWHRFDLLAYLLHGLAAFDSGSGGALKPVVQVMRDQLQADAQGQFLILSARPNLHALAMAVEALCQLDLDYACVGVIGPLADAIQQRILARAGNVQYKQALTRSRLALLIEAMGVLAGRVTPSERRRVERCIDALVGCLGELGALEPLSIAQVVRGLARQGARTPCHDALEAQFKALVPLLAGAKTPASRDAVMRCIGALARSLAECARSQVAAPSLGDAGKALESFIVLQKPATWTPLGLATLADAIDGLGCWCDAMPAHGQVLWAVLHAVPVVIADHGVQAQATPQAHGTMALQLQRLKARVPDELKPAVMAALAAMLSRVAEDLTQRRLGEAAAIEVACGLCVPGGLGHDEAHALSPGLKHLIDPANVPATVQGQAATLRLLVRLTMIDGLDDDVVQALQTTWAAVSGSLTQALERELAVQELSSLAHLAGELGWTTQAVGPMAANAHAMLTSVGAALIAGVDAWLSGCDPIEIVLAAGGLVRAGRLSQAETLLLAGLAQLNTDAVLAALAQADDATLVEWCHLLYDLVRLESTPDVHTGALYLLKNKVLPIAWKRIDEQHTGHAPAPTSIATLLYYVVMKAGEAVGQYWDEHRLPGITAKQAGIDRHLLRTQSARIAEWLATMLPIGALDKLAWSRIVEIEARQPSANALSLTRLDPKAPSLPVHPAAQFTWAHVFDELAKLPHPVPAQGQGMQTQPSCSLNWFAPVQPRKPRYTVLQRLTQGQLKLLHVSLPSDLNASFLEGVYLIDGAVYRLDIGGGSGQAYALPLADTQPGSACFELLQTLLPSVEASSSFASALMHGGPPALDHHGPAAHVLEGGFTIAVLPDQDPNTPGALVLPGLTLTTQTGLGFVKESVAQAWPWYQEAKHADGSAGQAVPLFGGRQPDAGLSPDALQHYQPSPEAAIEIVGDLSKMTADDGALQYQLLTQGQHGRGHRARSVPSTDGKLHLSRAKQLKGALVLDAGSNDAPRLQALDEAEVLLNSATAQVLDGSVWIAYSLVVRNNASGECSIFEGSLLVLPDAHWPPAHKDCQLLLPAGDERTRSSWRQQRKPTTAPVQLQAAGMLVVRDVNAPGSCAAVPPQRQRALGRDFGTGVLVCGGLPKLQALVKAQSAPPDRPVRSYRTAFQGDTYIIDHAPQVAASTHELRRLYADVLRTLRFISPQQAQTLAQQAMDELCGGLTPEMVSGLEHLVDEAMPQQEVAQQLAQTLGKGSADLPPALLKRWKALQADVDPKAKKGGDQKEDALALLAGYEDVPSNPAERLALWLYLMPRSAGEVPQAVRTLYTQNQAVQALELLVSIGLQADEGDTDADIDALYSLGMRLQVLIEGWAPPPYGPQTAQLIMQSCFDAGQAVAARNALQGPCNMAASVMNTAIGQAMDRAKLWTLEAPYKAPVVVVQAAKEPSRRVQRVAAPPQVKSVIERALLALKGKQYAKELRALRQLLRASTHWRADGVLAADLVGLVIALDPYDGSAASDGFAAALTDVLCRLYRRKQWAVEPPIDRAWAMGRVLRAALNALAAACKQKTHVPRGICYLVVELVPLLCPNALGDYLDHWGALREPLPRCDVFYRLFAAKTMRPQTPPLMNPTDAFLGLWKMINAQAFQALSQSGGGVLARQVATNWKPLFYVFDNLPEGRFTDQDWDVFIMGMAGCEPWHLAMTAGWANHDQQPLVPMEKPPVIRMPVKVACEIAQGALVFGMGGGQVELQALMLQFAYFATGNGNLGKFELQDLIDVVRHPSYPQACTCLPMHGLIANTVNILWHVRETDGLPGVAPQDWRWMACEVIWALMNLSDDGLNGALYVNMRWEWLSKLVTLARGYHTGDTLTTELGARDLPMKILPGKENELKQQRPFYRSTFERVWLMTVLRLCVTRNRGRRLCIDLSRLMDGQIRHIAQSEIWSMLGVQLSEWLYVGSAEQRTLWADAVKNRGQVKLIKKK